MTSLHVRIAVAGIAFYTMMAVSNADAAKGVKKTTDPDGQRIVTGVVTNLVPDGTGFGSFQVKTANQHKKINSANGVGGAGANAQQSTHTFNVTGATRYHHISGAAISGSHVKAGTRVRVTAMGNQAQNIQVLTGHRSMGSFTRHRANGYRPHIPPAAYHHRRR